MSHPSLPHGQHKPTAAFFGVTVANQCLPSAETNQTIQRTRNLTPSESNSDNTETDVTDRSATNMHSGGKSTVLTDATDEPSNSTFNLSSCCCDNCKREKTAPVSIKIPQCTVKLGEAKLNKGRLRRTFANATWVNVLNTLERSKTPQQMKTVQDNETVTLTLCSNCEHGLSSDCESREVTHIWPAVVWAWLTDPGLQDQCGDQLWALVPKLWRPWWVHQLQKANPAVHGSITLQEPPPVFADRSLEIEEMRTAMNENTLSSLRNACDKHMKPLVKCPWGCTDMAHKCTEKPFDIVVRGVLGQNVQTCTHDPREEMHEVVGVDQGYLHQSNVTLLLKNPAWAVQPSIAFSEKDGAPVVLACSTHKN